MARSARIAVAAAALTLSAPSASVAADTVFGGSTSAGEPFVVTAGKNATKLKSLAFVWEARCDDGRYFPLTLKVTAAKGAAGFSPEPDVLATSRNAKGRFAGVQLGARDLGEQVAGISTNVAGKLRRGKASGTLSAHVTIFDAASNAPVMKCATGRLRFSATSSPGRVYGGITSQEEPVVVRLDRKRRRATDVLIGWHSDTCDPPDNLLRYGERLTNFPVRAKRFGDVFEATVDGDAGGKVTYAYDFAGRLTSRDARGTFSVRATGRDVGGATTFSCDSGAITWKAATSGGGPRSGGSVPIRRGVRAATSRAFVH